MKFEPINCPECGELARGTVEWVPACAYFTEPDEKGEVEYSGETEPFWEGQLTETTEDGEVILECPEAHQWEAILDGQLTPSKRVIHT